MNNGARRFLLSGSFVQHALSRGWSQDDWRREFGFLKDAGMRYVVVYPAIDGAAGEAYYPTREPGLSQAEPIVANCLAAAKDAQMQAFLGLNYHEEWFQRYASDPRWLFAQMEQGNRVADELADAFLPDFEDEIAGWYWPWEVDNLNWQGQAATDTLTRALDITASHLHAMPRPLPLLLCPFMNYRCSSPQDYAQFWEYVFANSALGEGDIFAPQDCVGGTGLELHMVQEWFAALKQAVATKPGLRFWCDTETFAPGCARAATLDRLHQQLQAVKPYVEECLSFAYSHYYSPHSNNPGFHRAYCHYAGVGSLPWAALPAPTSAHASRRPDGSVALSWAWSGPDEELCGFRVCRNDDEVAVLQVLREKPASRPPKGWVDAAPAAGRTTYTIEAYGFAGERSMPATTSI